MPNFGPFRSAIALFLLGLAAFVASIRPAVASTVNIAASERGWVCESTPSFACLLSNNGADPANGYVAGNVAGPVPAGAYRDWFEFSIPALTGTLLSATLSLNEPSIVGHAGGPLTFSLYALVRNPQPLRMLRQRPFMVRLVQDPLTTAQT